MTQKLPIAGTASGTPLYRQISELLMQRIQTEDYPLGSLLPKEVDLAKQLGVSRVTLRHALTILEQSRIITRIRCAGTRVIAKQAPTTYVQSMDAMDGIFHLTRQTAMRIDRVSTERHADHPEWQELPSASGRWLRIEGVRHVHGQTEPSTWTCVLTDHRHAQIKPLLCGEVDSIYQLIEQCYGTRMHRVRHRIRACALPQEAAKALRLPVGSPCLEVCAWLETRDGTLIEYVQSLHNPAVITLELNRSHDL